MNPENVTQHSILKYIDKYCYNINSFNIFW